MSSNFRALANERILTRYCNTIDGSSAFQTAFEVVSGVEAEQRRTQTRNERNAERGKAGGVTTPTGRVHFPRWQGCRLVAYTGLGCRSPRIPGREDLFF